MGGVPNHLSEVADLAAGAEAFGADDEVDGDGGEVVAKALDEGDCGVVREADAEDELVGAGVLLTAVAGERLVHAIVDAFEGFEEGDAGVEGRCGGVGAADGAREGAGGEQSDDHVGQAAQREQEEHRFDCEGHLEEFTEAGDLSRGEPASEGRVDYS